uniref:Uncharacterized protein n=1 Tax=Knipowitschia caucasica TaxID=637954 RepID=A0AAV2KNB2_KNICA
MFGAARHGRCVSTAAHRGSSPADSLPLVSPWPLLLAARRYSVHPAASIPGTGLLSACRCLPATVHPSPCLHSRLNKNKLKTELSLIYSNDEFKSCSGAVALYQLFMENNLQDTFSETVALLKILITTPMTTAESESLILAQFLPPSPPPRPLWVCGWGRRG